MASTEYLLALGENRWAFAAADYQFIYFLMTIDREFQVLIDRPAKRAAIVTSGQLPKYLRKLLLGCPAPTHLVDQAIALGQEWKKITYRRNRLAHAWATQINVRSVNLAGLCTTSRKHHRRRIISSSGQLKPFAN